MRCRRTEWANAKIKQCPWYQLTGCGYEIEESLLGEQRVFQAPEVEFQDSCHWVDVLVRLVINQRILPCAVITHSITHFPAVSVCSTKAAVMHYELLQVGTKFQRSSFQGLSRCAIQSSRRTRALFVCTLAAPGRRLWLFRRAKRNLKSIRRSWPRAPGLTSFKCIFNIVDFDLGARHPKYTLLLKTCVQRQTLEEVATET